MCIICNAGDVGDDFLSAFESSRSAMRDAAKAMLKVKAAAPQHAAQYDRAHKQMVRLIREWNKVEMLREQHMEPRP